MVRVFWILIAVLVAVTAAVFLLPDGSSDPSEQSVTSPVSSTSQADIPEAAVANEARAEASAGVPAERPGGEPTAPPATKPDPVETAPQINPPSDMPNPDALELQIPKPSDTGVGTDPGSPVESVTTPPAEIEDAAEAQDMAPTQQSVDSAVESQEAAPAETDETETSEPIPGDPEADEASEAAPEPTNAPANEPDSDSPVTESTDAQTDAITDAPAPVVAAPAQPVVTATPAKAPATEPVVKTPTGLLLDGRWNVEGKGTPDSPYQIEWDMLVAMQRDYSPRLGKTEIPAWMAALDGKTVTIRGYALLPMGVSSLSELLVMLNQWDSCCIGVPPTPYDAIEVRLAKPLSNSAQSMFSHTGALSFGDLTGTFKIDPYIVQGYLLGLYLLEDASANLLGPAGTP